LGSAIYGGQPNFDEALLLNVRFRISAKMRFAPAANFRYPEGFSMRAAAQQSLP